MIPLTVAQLRAYQQICDAPSGHMLVIAMDQRASMRNLIQVASGEATDADLDHRQARPRALPRQ